MSGQRETQSCHADPPTASAGPMESSESRTALQGYKNQKEIPGTYTRAITSQGKRTALRKGTPRGLPALYRWGNPWRGGQLKAVCSQLALQMGQERNQRTSTGRSTYVHVLPVFTIKSTLQESLRTWKVQMGSGAHWAFSWLLRYRSHFQGTYLLIQLSSYSEKERKAY